MPNNGRGRAMVSCATARPIGCVIAPDRLESLAGLVDVPKGVAELGRDEAVAGMAEEDNERVELVGVPIWSGYCCSSSASGCCSCTNG
jgi:hypothetical protein